MKMRVGQTQVVTKDRMPRSDWRSRRGISVRLRMELQH